MGVATLVSATLIFLHAIHLSRPAEQIKYVLRLLPRRANILTFNQNNPHHCSYSNFRAHILHQHLSKNFRHLPRAMG